MGVVREARSGDGSLLSPLMTTLGYPSTPEAIEARLKNIIAHPDFCTFVYEEQGELLGMIGCHMSLAYHTDDLHIRVISFVVDSTHQGKGIGRRLMSEVEEWGRTRGVKNLVLNSGNREERAVAHHVYEKLGFRGTAKGFYKQINT